MKKQYFHLLIIFFLTQSFTLAEMWPTNAPELLSGTFGEKRAGHFHSGIDIKTWARSGYECYAIGNGYISKIKESPGGYGKVLYLKLDDGRTVVYSHLDKFNGSLEKIAYSIKYKNRTNLVNKDFQPNKIRVRKGNLIAYTGGSGTRYPHLHFEIRDENGRPVNPLTNGFKIEDKLPPLPLQIAVSPADKNSKVMGLNSYSVYPVDFFRNNIYLCQDTIQASGKIQISLQVYDQSASGNNNGIYRLDMYHQGKKCFTKKFDSFDFEETDMILLDRNYKLAAHGLGDFHACYSNEINQYFSAYDSLKTGLIDVLPGYQMIVIQVRDTHGNRSSVRFTVYGGDYPDYEFPSHKTASFFSIHTDSLLAKEKISHFTLKQYNPYGHLQETKQIFPENMNSNNIILNNNKLENSVLSIQYTDSLAYESYPQFFYFNQKSIPLEDKIHLRTHHYDDRILIEIYSDKALSHELIFAIENEGYETLKLNRISMNSLVTDPLTLSQLKNVKGFDIFEKSGLEWLHHKKIKSFVALQNEKNYWMAPDSNLALIIPRKAYYQDAFVWLEKVKVPKAPSGGEILSDCYHIYPEDIPTRKGLSFAFRFKNDFPLTKDIGVYKYNSKKEKWQSIRSKIPDPTRKFIDIKGLNGGIISVIRDIEPPELIKSYPGPGGNYRLKDINRKIWFQLEDNLSGFGDGGNINIYIDGEWKVFYYNAVTKVVTIDNPNLKSGPHTIQLLIEDKAGNLLDKRINFNTIR